VRLRARENGPWVVEVPPGARVFWRGEEVKLAKPGLALCRCGWSGDKPFCDGSHKEAGFVAPGGVLELVEGIDFGKGRQDEGAR